MSAAARSRREKRLPFGPALLLPALLVARPSAAIAPDRALTQVQVDIWRVEDGLPQNTVTSIVRTRRGHLWFGTNDGLVRFDGDRFTVFDGRATPVLAAGATVALMEDRRGRLWIGRNENVVLHEDGTFRQVLGAGELGQGTVWGFCEAPDGTVWGAAARGLVRWKDGKARLLTEKEGFPAVRFRSVCVDEEGVLWAGTNGAGLVSVRSGLVTVRSRASGFPSNDVLAVLPDPSGGIWAATAGGGLVRLRGKAQRVWGTADGLPTDQLTALAFDATGALWIGTWGGGICRFHNGAFETLGVPSLADDKVWSLLPDAEGFVWAGTWIGGLHRLRDRSFPVHGVPEGLSNDNVRSVLIARDGSVWAATAGGGVNRLHQGHVEIFRKSDGLPSDEVSSLCEDRSGAIWAGTYTAGIARIRGRRIETFGREQGLPALDVRVVREDRQGTIWAATTAGIATSRDGRRFEACSAPAEVKLTDVLCLLDDRNGVRWFGTAGDGLVRRDDAGFRVLTTRDGLVSDRIMSLHEDGDGNLWIGTAWSGLNLLRDGRLTSFRQADGLAEGRIHVILEDGLGGLWLTGNRGFQRLLKRELLAVASGRSRPIRSLSFGAADGLRSASFAGGQQPAGASGPDGRLWLPSDRGIVVVDPSRLPSPPAPPGARIEEVLVDGTPRAVRNGLEVGPGRHMVEIRYAATTLQPAGLIRFRFRLDDFDADWHDADTRRSAFYIGLPPGRYAFRVASRVGEGAFGAEAPVLSLRVLPALHETAWFRVLAALLVAAGGVGFVFRRTVHLRRRHSELETLVAERTEELRHANEKLSDLSLTDALTGIPNRRRFDEALVSEWMRGIRFGSPLSVVMVDIDRFKAYNDALGHPAGDRCIAEVAAVLQASARRAGDLVARYGGEEFVMLLPVTAVADAVIVAERARSRVEALRFPHPDGPAPFVTASFGVATFIPETAGDPARLVALADEALYRAKDGGRNRVEAAAQRGAAPPASGREHRPPDDPPSSRAPVWSGPA